MKIEYKGSNLSEKEKEKVWEILCQCDREFYPPLSARNSSSQKNLSHTGIIAEEQPTVYYAEMIQQDFILAYEGEDVVGFMTFKQKYECEALTEFGTSLYITTVCVKKERRGHGIMKAMYQTMEQEVAKVCDCNKVSTRTWSLNDAQIHELSRRGYEKLCVLENHRGPGVDTVYFGIVLDIPAAPTSCDSFCSRGRNRQ